MTDNVEGCISSSTVLFCHWRLNQLQRLCRTPLRPQSWYMTCARHTITDGAGWFVPGWVNPDSQSIAVL